MVYNYPLISVIIPVYNVERYLRRCVDSVLLQTYPNIEIILVNDGSSDHSQEICENYAKTQPSVRALKKPNGGLSSARNIGLNSARGKYIGFIDSDDWVAPDMYQYLFDLIDEHKADASQVEYELAYDNHHSFSDIKEKLEVIQDRENILEYYMEQTTRTGLYSVCICLFKAEFAKMHLFREGKTSEDMDYKFKVLSECRRFVSSNLPKYHYFQAGSSTSSGVLVRKNFELYESAEVLYNLTLTQVSPRTRYLGRVKLARTAFSLLSKAAFYGISEEIGKTDIRELVDEHRKNVPILLRAPLPVSRKMAAIFLAINFKMTCALVKVYHKFRHGKI